MAALPEDRVATAPPLPAGIQAGESSELLIFLQPGADPLVYATEHGLVYRHTLRSDRDAHVFAAADTTTARAHLGRARTSVRVRRAYPNERLQRIKTAWVPNDPYYTNGNPAGFPGQWHLGNGAVPGVDIHVPAAWNRDITGTGVLVGIVDDCLQTTHPDLAPNYVAADSWDFGQNDSNPDPVNTGGANEDRHGTSVAGVAAARGGNGIGGTGAAPLAGLAGLRIDFPTQTTAMFVDATLYHSSAGTTPIKIKNHSYGYSTPYIEAQAERDAVITSAASGTIHCFAAGNERGASGQDSNKQDLQSCPDIIAVAAFGSDGKFAYYSSFGANVFVTAPSSGVTGFGITTTDRVGATGYNSAAGTGDGDGFPDLDYTSTFGGTSSATPLTAGVLALVKQAQPALDGRFAKHLLARTSQVVDPTDNSITGGGDGATAGSAWKTNAAGFHFNENYGFGLLDADQLTQKAVLYTGVTPLQTESTGTVAVAAAIPDSPAAGLTQTFALSSTTPLEEMVVTLTFTHTRRGDLTGILTSPSGTQSRLFVQSTGDTLGVTNFTWTYVSNAFWGENPAGTWTLRLQDVRAGRTGTLVSYAVTSRMGTLLDPAVPAVSSIDRVGAALTGAASVDFTVTFTKSVTGVNAGDFVLATTGVVGASVTGVSGAGSTRTVTVNTGSGNGTIRLDVLDNDSIVDGGAIPLGGVGVGNGNFTTGQVFTIDKSPPSVTQVTSSTANGAYALGAVINVTVNFSEAVTLSGGNLQVPLSTGDIVTIAPFGPATTAAGTYTVGAGDNSPDLNAVSPLTLSAGSLVDAAGNACVLTIPAGQNLADLKGLIVDTTSPQIVRVRSTTPDGAYRVGAAINVTVDFTEPVTLVGGNLQVTLSTGDVVTIPPFGPATSASGTYTVGAGDTSADLNESSPLTLSAGTLRDAAANACALAVPAGQNLADLKNLVIDTTSPTVTINQAAGQADPTNASPIIFTVVFSEAVTGFTPGDVTLGGTAGATTAVVTGAGPTYTVTVTGMTGSGTVTATLAAGVAADLAGNPSAASTSSDNVVTFDATPPSVTINQAGGQADPTNGSSILFTVVFSKPVTGFATGDVTLGGTAGATTAVVSGVGPTYTVTVSGMTGSGTVTASLAAGVATDTIGNASLASTSTDNIVTYDATPPTVTINQAAAQADPTNSSSILFTVVFSEAVTGFATGDVSFAGSTVGGALVGTVTGSGPTYTVTVTGMTGSGTVVASLPAGVATDLAGNLSAASTSTDNTVTRDITPPSVTINQAAGQADPTNAGPILFTVVFSKAVTGFATGDVTLGGTAGATTAVVSGPGPTYTVTVSGMTGSGTVTASLAAGVAADLAGNASSASTSTDNVVAYDIAPPTVTINQAAGQVDPTNSAPILYTVVFSKPVTGFATGDVTLGGTAGATTATVSGVGPTYTVTVSGMTGSGTVVASIAAGAATDLAGNASAASTSTDNVVTYDTAPPTVTINQAGAQADPTNNSAILFTVVFSEPVIGFATGDVTLGGTAGATTAVVSGPGPTYTVTVSGMTGSGTVTASLAAGVATDAAGNASLASTSTDNTVTVDATVPTVTINQAAAQGDPVGAGPVLFTVVFSESVTGFDATDVSLIGSTVGGTLVPSVSGSGTTYTVSVTGMTGTGTVVATIPAGAAVDAVGNLSTASTSSDNTVTFSSVLPTVTINQAGGQTDPTKVASVVFSVVFSEAVNGFATGDVSFAGSTAGGSLVGTVTGASPGTTFTVTVTGMTSSGTIVAAIPAGVATSAATGNANAASTATDNTVTYDITAPSVTINQAAGQADPTNGSPILFTVVFSEPVTGFATGDVTLGGTAGATTAAVSGSGTTYTVSVSGMTQTGTVIASVAAGAAADAAGNASLASTSTDNTVTFDITPLTVTINQAGGQADPTNGSSILYSVVFSKPVTGFATGDVSFASSTVGGALTGTVTGSGATYTVTVTGMTGSGTVVASIPAGVATDSAANPNTASTSTDNTVTRDITPPSVTINQAVGQADPTNTAPVVFTVVFSEAVTGFATGDVTLGGTAGATTAIVSGAGPTYTVTVSGMTGSGTVVASIPLGAATDLAGNASAASTSTDNVVAYDTAPPTVTINQAGAQADPTNGSSILFTVVFSKPVTGFATGDVTLGGTAGATTAVVSGPGPTYTVTVSGMTGDGTVIASIGASVATDAAGNGNLASTSTDNTVTVDATAPTVTINQAAAQADPTNGSSILYTVVFSEPVTGFATGDVTLGGTAGATTAAVSGSGTTYTVTVTGMTGTGTVIASIGAGVAADPAGNASAASTSTDNVVTYDIAPLSVTINQAAGQADPTNGSAILFTVVFSKPVTGFATGDVSFAGSTAGGALVGTVTGSGAAYTVTVTGMTGSGNVVASIPAGVATDAAANPNAASTSTDNTVTRDITPPSVTINQAAAQADPTNSSSILFTVVFSEAVTGFATGDVTLGGTAGATTAVVSGAGPTYTVTVSGMTGSGTVTASLAAGVATDTAGNASLASTSTDNTVAYDGVAPTVTINAAAGQPNPARTTPLLFTAQFSEPVTGFTAADVVVGGTAGGTASVSGGPTTYTVSVAGLSGDGTVIVTIPAGAASDPAGNTSLASTGASNSVTFDATAPVVTQVTSTSPNAAYGLGSVIPITVVFSEPVTVTGLPTLTLETGAVDAVVAFTSGSGTSTLVFTYTVAAGHVSTDLDYIPAAALALSGGTIRDLAGNDATLTLAAPGSAGSLGASKNLVVDTTPPLTGVVNDGWTAPDVDTQLSVTTLSANWSGFSDPQSGVAGYEWAIGTTSGGQDLLAFTPVGLQTGASTSALNLLLALANGSTCYVTVRATNGVGLTSTATSDGVAITGTASSGPAAPPGFFAVAGDQAALLEWLPSPSAGVAFYRVWWKPASSPWTEAIRVDPLAGTTATISGLTNGTAYDFMIKAVDVAENESAGVFASATPLASITIGGGGGYGSVQAAIDAAAPGETVLLGPGTYTGTLILHPGVSLGGAGPGLTLIVGTAGSPVITVQGSFPTDPTSTISNLTITTGTVGVEAGTADVLLHHVIIHHVTSHGAASAAGSRLRAVNCTILSNGGDGIHARGTTEVRNCILGKNGGAGLDLSAGALVNYDEIYANVLPDALSGAVGTGNTTAAAVFLDEPAKNFIEDPNSPSVDAGDPLDAYSQELSPNGSRINQGAFGNTRWAARSPAAVGPPPPSGGGGGGGGGGCGLLGLDAVLALALLGGFRRRRSRS